MGALLDLATVHINSVEYFFRLGCFSFATFTFGLWVGITTWKIRGGYWRRTDYEHILSSASIIVMMLGYMMLQIEALYIDRYPEVQIGSIAFPIGTALVAIWLLKMVNEILHTHGRRENKDKKKKVPI